MFSLTFEQFYARVSMRIESIIGVGLESLSDVDLWDYYSSEPEDRAFWITAIKDAAEYAVSEQDDMPSDIVAMF